MYKKITVAVFLTIAAVWIWGCGVKLSSEKVLSDEQIVQQAEEIIFDLQREYKFDPRETVFTVSKTASSGKLVLEGKTSDRRMKEELIARLSRIEGVTVEDKIELLPSRSLGDRIYGVVKVPVLNLGEEPGRAEGKSTVTQARMGDVVMLLEEYDGWYRVRMEDGYLGWADGSKLWIADKPSLDGYLSGRFALVVSKMAVPLSGIGGRRVFDRNLVQGTTLPLISLEGNWARLMLPGGGEVYVRAEDIREFPSREEVFSEKRDASYVIAVAKQYVGLPYLWGGTTAYGYDCSGFTQFCFRMGGYFLRRDADMQFEQGEPIRDRKDLRPGDLVFFETYKPGPSHVGIYLGDMKFIHAGSSSGVTVNSFDPNDPAYSKILDKKYLGAHRIIP